MRLGRRSYIPSALSESVSTTIFLSSSRHLFIIVSESENTTELTVDDILFLSAFIMQRHTATCQRCKSSSNIELRTAGDAYMKTWQAKVDELLDKRKDLSTRRWDSRRVWTLVERVQNNVHGPRMGNREHILETTYHSLH